MAASTSNPLSAALGIVVTRRKPGHFVALTEAGRIDATLAQGGKLAEVLEKRSHVNVNGAMRGPSDGMTPLEPSPGIKSIDPYEVAIAMPAADGEPVVSQADREAWTTYRVAYDVTLTAPPFTVTGVLLLFPTQDPLALTERGTELFVPVFGPTVQIGEVTIKDTPSDAILINRAHIRRVKATMR
jgi:hypothetical protein